MTVQTKYGTLNGVIRSEYYNSGALKDCTVEEKSPLLLPCGKLIPQYQEDDVRRKHISSVRFYESGAVQAISLQAQTQIPTPAGVIPAEFITFYESGAIKRLFPLNGKLSGYWGEKNEFALATPVTLAAAEQRFTAKAISVQFYEGGAMKSFTLWPRETVSVLTIAGSVLTHIGVAFYEDGAVRSLEPARPADVPTPIGAIPAFDVDAVGVSGDSNSLELTQNGRIKALITSSASVTVTDKDGQAHTHAPALALSHFDDERKRVIPMRVRFGGGEVSFPADQASYEIGACTFRVARLSPAMLAGDNCDGCDE